MFARKKKKKWPVVLAVCGAVLLLLSLTTFCVAGTATLELQGQLSENITLEYGKHFEPETLHAVLKSPLFGEAVLKQPVQVIDSVNTQKTGSYEVAYQASFLWMKGTQIQTVTIVDTQAPMITLVPDEDGYTLPGHEYEEAGFSAVDDYDGDITHLVRKQVDGDVITYSVTDSAGNTAQVQRTIHYDDPVPPVLELNGGEEYTVSIGRPYEEPGYTANDNADGDLTQSVQVSGTVDTSSFGAYVLTYTVNDAFGNTAEVQRTVTVAPAPQPEVVIPEEKVIYLTFDDGPGPYTERLLEVLQKYDVRATFFVTNSYYVDLLPSIAAAGHSIGVHTATHVYEEIYASEEAFFADFKTIYDVIYEKTGIETTLMRFPGGSSNRVSRFNEGIMTRLTQMVTDYGLQYFDWNVSSLDAGGAKTAEQVYNNVIAGVSGKQYAVVLQHDIHSFSVDAVEMIIQWGLANGYTFLPLEPSSPPCHQTILN